MKTKTELVKRWEDILQETIDRLPELRQLYLDPVRNEKYDFNASLYSDHRCIGVLDYLLNNNALSFKANIKKAIPL